MIAERWERRKYEANIRGQILQELTEALIGVKNELHFLLLDVGTIDMQLRNVEDAVGAVLLQQNPQMPAGQLGARKAELVAPLKQFMNQFQFNRWVQYNNSVKGPLARGESFLNLAEHFSTTPGLHTRLMTVFNRLCSDLDPSGIDGARKRLEEFKRLEPEFKHVQRVLRDEIDAAMKNVE